jgi:hypothetical protein
MSRLLKEPLLNFFLLGALVFMAYGWLGDGVRGVDEIVVSRGQQENLIQTFERTWRRPPTAEELNGLIEDFIRMEIAYRESLAMNLDRDDIVIKRRMRQKLELLTEDLAAAMPPTEAELEEYLAANAETFRSAAIYSLEHIYFSPDRRGNQVEADAFQVLKELQEDALDNDSEALGDSITLPARLTDASDYEISSIFGSQFLGGLGELRVGAWGGPIRSGFGMHLVRVSDRVEGTIPMLADIKEDVENELRSERRNQAVDSLYANLAKNYIIRIEPLVPVTPSSPETDTAR